MAAQTPTEKREQALAFLGPRWVLARELPRLDRRPEPEPRPVPEHLRAEYPAFLRRQAG